jgi:hypothetical protein
MKTSLFSFLSFPSFLSLFSFLSFFSCASSPAVDYGLGEYYVEIVTALEQDGFRLDTGKTVYNVDKGDNHAYEPGDRVYLNFSYLEGSSDQITVHGAAKISTGELKSLSTQTIASYPDDPVRLESAWTGSCYLNAQFYIEYQSEAHKIALMIDENTVNDPEVKLYFRHDKNNDSPGYLTPAYVSFDLKKVLGEPLGNRSLTIDFNTTNYGNKTYTFKY